MQALAHCEQALARSREIGDPETEASAWDSLGYIHRWRGRYTEAVTCYERAIAIRRDIGNRYHEAASLDHLGDARQEAGDRAAAEAAWRQALDILDQLNHPQADDVRIKLDG